MFQSKESVTHISIFIFIKAKWSLKLYGSAGLNLWECRTQNPTTNIAPTPKMFQSKESVTHISIFIFRKAKWSFKLYGSAGLNLWECRTQNPI